MKKVVIKKVQLVLILGMLLLPFWVSAQSLPDPQKVLEDKLGTRLSDIPQTPEAIANQYLTQEWGNIIIKNKFLGPVHTAFTNNPLIFNILFAQPYTLSLTFFCLVILWLLIIGTSTDIISSGIGLKKGVSWLLAGLFAIILAQVGILKVVVTFVLDIILSQADWWIRLLFFIIAGAALLVYWYASKAIAKSLKASKERKKSAEQDEKIKELEAFEQGVQKTQEERAKKYPGLAGWKQTGATRFRKGY